MSEGIVPVPGDGVGLGCGSVAGTSAAGAWRAGGKTGPTWITAGDAYYVSVLKSVLSCSTPSTVTIFHSRERIPLWADCTCLLVPGASAGLGTSLGAPGEVTLKVSDWKANFRFGGLLSLPYMAKASVRPFVSPAT